MDWLNRPLVWSVVYFILGIIGGELLRNTKQFPLFFIIILSLLVLVWWCKCSKKWVYLVCMLFFLLGALRLLYYPVVREEALLSNYQTIKVIGVVESVKTGKYGSQCILKKVVTIEGKLSSKILLKVPKAIEVHPGDHILSEGKWSSISEPMNPSDYDFKQYMRSQNVCGELQVDQVKVLKERSKNKISLRGHLEERINQLFYPRDKGLINLLILGEKKFADETVTDAYYDLGIGHILTISGFHITIIIVGVWCILAAVGVTYRTRHLTVILIIWGYGMISGLGVSTVRACWVATIVAFGRCMRQEEDLPTSLGIAAFMILYLNPYSLMQVSFQLSFMAMVGVMASGILMERLKRYNQVSNWCMQLMSSAIISFLIFPIVAYHFFRVSLVGILLNLLFIPVFALVLPVSFILIGLSYFHFSLAYTFGKMLTLVLDWMNHLALWTMDSQWAVWTSGRPSGLVIGLYYMTIGIVFWIVLELVESRMKRVSWKTQWLLVLLLSVWLGKSVMEITGVKQMEIAQLYVGQGDASVVITPNGKTLLIDSGKVGQGETIKRFLNYKGKNKIDYVILSHPHDDHIGGMLDLLETDLKIGGIILDQKVIDNETQQLMSSLKKACQNKSVPFYNIEKDMGFMIDGVTVNLGAGRLEHDLNEASLTCEIVYKNYQQLFTGDIGFEREEALKKIGDIDVLKVAHHGSRYATGDDFLLQTKPEYGIISSGINNRYNHPHPSTVKRMQEHGVKVYGTQDVGAISIRTDGDRLEISNQLQKEPIIYDRDSR